MEQPSKPLKTMRMVILGLVAVIVVVGAAFVVLVISHAGARVSLQQVDVLANSTDDCVTCHREESPGIVSQFSHSGMAAANVACHDCHEVTADYPGAEEHEGTYILASPTSARCQRCHDAEVTQFYQSRHSMPAYVAVAGSKGLSSTLLAMYQAIPEGSFAPDKPRNAVAVLEGEAVTPFTCENCHSIGLPAADGSVGRCQKCHLRHEFSLAQARKPETCNNCHIGPDHPQGEIYQESPHGILYATQGSNWNWNAAAGNLTVSDLPAPSCAVCHMSGFGGTGTTHDVGDRLSWFLFASISTQRPAWQDNRARMQSVCFTCHNETFVKIFYTTADAATQQVNTWVQESNDLIAPLQKLNLINTNDYNEPIDFTYFDLWHFYGRTTKFGTWMQGADYSQWHGAYPLQSTMATLREMVNAKLQASGATP
jgi:hydroxylamine dehydrogenase